MEIMIVVVKWWWSLDLCSCYDIGYMKVIKLSCRWCFKLCLVELNYCFCGFMFKSEMNMPKFDRNQLKLIESCKFSVDRGLISITEIKINTGTFLFRIKLRCLHEICSYEC